MVGGCAIDDRFEAKTASSLIYVIRGDGRELWRSPPVVPGERSLVPFQIPVAGVKELALQVVCPGPFGSAMALWVNPAFH